MDQRQSPAFIQRYDMQKFIVLLVIALIIVALLVAREYQYF